MLRILKRGAMAKKILVAEPNDYLSELFIGLFSAFGYETVRTSTDRLELINHQRAFEANLLLIDFDMLQQMDIRAVRAQFPELIVVGSLWHEAIDGFTEIAKRLGLDGFFSKYAPQEQVLNLIKKLLT